MSVKFTSHKKEVLEALSKAKRSALERMGDYAVMKAQDYATVDTGNMRDSITHEYVDENTERYGTSNDKAFLKPVDYAPFVELGTTRMRAQPFIRPAAENNRGALEQIANSVIGEYMSKI